MLKYGFLFEIRNSLFCGSTFKKPHYTLLHPLPNVPPGPGTRWRANFYRMDYDDGKHSRWHWAPTEVNFHEYERFGVIMFE